MNKFLFLAALAALPITSHAETTLVKNLKVAPEMLCSGNPSKAECENAVKKMIIAVEQTTKASTMCDANQDKLHLLSEEQQKQCSDFKEATDYIESLNR